eukprot:m51a1_g3142 putative 60S ribosomal protein L32e (131) ;mRNA; f:309273-309917
MVKIVKKRTKTFPRFQSDLWKRVKPSWRKPHGIDNRVRRCFRGSKLMPKIGYGSARATKYMRPDGKLTFNVHNVKELDLLMMHNKTYDAEVCHNVSGKLRQKIAERARALGVKLTYNQAKLKLREKAKAK